LPYPEAPDAGAALFEAVGPSVLVSHSHGGFLSWALALRTSHVKGIISYEPVRFIFPRGERPADSDLGIWKTDMPGQREAEEVPLAEFLKLTRFPIQLVYGDFLNQPGTNDTKWRDALRAAKAFQQVVNRHGGDVEILELPEVGVRGNTHFPFADRNNREVADLMADWLRRKALDVYSDEITERPAGDR
jgi:pimeloyl-ACP methyl ester carboxylesterase